MKLSKLFSGGLLFLLCIVSTLASAAGGLEAVTVTPSTNGGQTYTISLQTLLFMTALSLLPAALLMMTSFTRIIIVLAILRQALGTGATPTNQMLIGIALFMTFFIMTPVFSEIYATAVQPYVAETITAQEALNIGAQPLKKFMLAQTRNTDLEMFVKISGNTQLEKAQDTPFTVLMPAFMTSELKTGFQIGFLIFIPFLIIDLVVASVLMSMGMMMLSPMVISLPFKIMLFVLVDGWSLLMGTLAASFS